MYNPNQGYTGPAGTTYPYDSIFVAPPGGGTSKEVRLVYQSIPSMLQWLPFAFPGLIPPYTTPIPPCLRTPLTGQGNLLNNDRYIVANGNNLYINSGSYRNNFAFTLTKVSFKDKTRSTSGGNYYTYTGAERIAKEDDIIRDVDTNKRIKGFVKYTSATGSPVENFSVTATNCATLFPKSTSTTPIDLVLMRDSRLTGSINDFLLEADTMRTTVASSTFTYSVDLKRQNPLTFTKEQSSCGANMTEYAFVNNVPTLTSITKSTGRDITISGSWFLNRYNDVKLTSTTNPGQEYILQNIASSDNKVLQVVIPETIPGGNYSVRVRTLGGAWSSALSTVVDSCTNQKLKSIYDKLPETIEGKIMIPGSLSSIAALNATSIKAAIVAQSLDGKSFKDALQIAIDQMGAGLREGAISISTVKEVAKLIDESIQKLGKENKLSPEETLLLYAGMSTGDAPFTVVSFTFEPGRVWAAGFGSKLLYKVKKDTSRPWPKCGDLNAGMTNIPSADIAPPPSVNSVSPVTGSPDNTFRGSGLGFDKDGNNSIKLTPVSPSSMAPSSVFLASAYLAFEAIERFLMNLFSILKVEAQVVSSSGFYAIYTVSGDQSSATFTVPATVPDGTYKVSMSRAGGLWIDTTHTITVRGNGAGDPGTIIYDWSSMPLPATVPVVTLTVVAPSTLLWTSTDAMYCGASGAWTGARATSGSLLVNPTIASMYTIICANLLGDSESVSVQLAPQPPVLNPYTASASLVAGRSDNTITGSGFSPTGNKVQLTTPNLQNQRNRTGGVTSFLNKNKNSLASLIESVATTPTTVTDLLITYEIKDIPSTNGTSITFTIPRGIPSAMYTLKVASLTSDWSPGTSVQIYSRELTDETTTPITTPPVESRASLISRLLALIQQLTEQLDALKAGKTELPKTPQVITTPTTTLPPASTFTCPTDTSPCSNSTTVSRIPPLCMFPACPNTFTPPPPVIVTPPPPVITPTVVIPPPPTVTTTPPPASTPTEPSLSATLTNTSADQAGPWGSFAPAPGTTYGSSGGDIHDFVWSATLTLSGSKTIRSINLTHNTGGEYWSTDNANAYPLVIFNNNTQLNTAYGQTLGTYGQGNTTLTIYGQFETPTFSGGTLTITFTDNTSVTTTIPASSFSPCTTCTSQTSAVFEALGDLFSEWWREVRSTFVR